MASNADNRAEQAANSAASAHRAVEAAEEHPTDKLIGEAENSVRRAEVAVRQAEHENQDAEVAPIARQLEEDRTDLEGQ